MIHDRPLAHEPLEALTVERGTRPAAPPIAGVTPAQREAGGHLAAIHRYHLMEIARLTRVMDALEAGEYQPGKLAETLHETQMLQNLRAVGTLCGRECMALTAHHDIEEAHMFPGLSAVGVAALTAVVDRLKEEHLVVHELLHRFEEAARALDAAPGADTFADARAVLEKLAQVVASHFGYEETELRDAIGVHLGGI
ncbi:hemerythrin domain-containing protein [Wenxinia marina]|uniref:Hemerythrin-like domain-containing protein n=1 Tax=Wenxinia marina DSM 24838 TaxID=1123501 RepID=A0A0D0NGW2_9RHOB|nr:hemerythrin domain-containing protein [Wenxinia marina]KIQ67575.1 hypothetical protein Wenmar_04001 [Wenxinia marina DSM 24838]GGL68334.1 hypothetical protein GCM10011392_23560 [Wenxinia marina]